MTRSLRIVTAVVFWLTSIAGACAESASETMKGFGLIGAWAVDCVKPYRTTYSTALLGSPTIVSISAAGALLEKNEYEVSSVMMITEDKIKIDSTWTSGDFSNSPGDTFPLPLHKPPLIQSPEMVIMKIGNKIQIFDLHSQDGKLIGIDGGHYYEPSRGRLGPTPIWEKCLN
jgi:hypothetical protein